MQSVDNFFNGILFSVFFICCCEGSCAIGHDTAMEKVRQEQVIYSKKVGYQCKKLTEVKE